MFLLQFDNAWEHEWESLMSVLSGVSEEEANWQAPCYTDTPAAAEWPARGTIRWQVAHVAHCKREYTARLRSSEREGPSPNLPHRPTRNYAEDLHELRQAHADQRQAIGRLGAEELTEGVADFLANTLRHDIWHGGQIAVARRLYRMRAEG